MKDSGIKWIGKIPRKWKISKIKFHFDVINGSTPDSGNYDYWDGDVKWITPADMLDAGKIKEGERTITRMGYDSCGTTMLPEGSIVVSTRAPIGKINIVTEKLCTNQGCKSLVCTGDNRYFYYYLIARKEQLLLLGKGTTFMELGTFDFKNLYILVPQLESQIAISDYLDKKCASIDNVINDKQAQLRMMQQHQKSLVYEYVTGKKRVKEAL